MRAKNFNAARFAESAKSAGSGRVFLFVLVFFSAHISTKII